jgi:hypothetical protein
VKIDDDWYTNQEDVYSLLETFKPSIKLNIISNLSLTKPLKLVLEKNFN